MLGFRPYTKCMILFGSDTVGNHNPCTRVIVSWNILHGCTYCGRSPSNLTFFCPACTNVQFAKFKTPRKNSTSTDEKPQRDKKTACERKGFCTSGGSVNNWAGRINSAMPCLWQWRRLSNKLSWAIFCGCVCCQMREPGPSFLAHHPAARTPKAKKERRREERR